MALRRVIVADVVRGIGADSEVQSSLRNSNRSGMFRAILRLFRPGELGQAFVEGRPDGPDPFNQVSEGGSAGLHILDVFRNVGVEQCARPCRIHAPTLDLRCKDSAAAIPCCLALWRTWLSQRVRYPRLA